MDAWEHWDGRRALCHIQVPTLVLWGDCDRSYPWPQPEALWRGIPAANLAVVPRCAHAVHLEKPDLFNRIVGDFLAADTSQRSSTSGYAGARGRTEGSGE